MTPAERLRFPLRLAVVVSGLSGLLALGTASLLSIPATVAVAVCFLAGSAASIWLSSAEEARLRRGASIAVLLMVGGYAAHSALAGLGEDPLVAIGPVLALLLCGLQVAHALVLNIRRDLLVGLTIGLFMTVLAAGLAPGPSVAAPLLVGWPVAVTALVLAQRLERLESGQLVAAPVGPSLRSRGSLAASTAKTVGISLVAGLVVFLLLPQPTGLSARSRLLGADAPIDSSGETRGTDYYSSGVMDLRTRGSLSDAPVIDVPGDSPELWRGAVLSTYDGQTWYARPESLGFLDQATSYVLPHPFDTLPATADRTDTVRLLAGFTGSIVTPGVAESITVDGGVNVSADGALGLSWTQTPPATYTLTSRPEVLDPAVLKSSTGKEPTDSRWLQLPQTLPQRVRDLAATLTVGLPTRYAQVRAVETYLRSHEVYQLDSPLPAPGADAVDDFLFTSHAGFCEQFASAEVVLLRTRGIPARLATGLAYGTPLADGNRRMLVSNAHAWVEVWYPGAGWSTSDPTAGSRLASSNGPTWLSRLVHRTLDTAGSRAVAAAVVGGAALALALVLRMVVSRRRRRLDRLAVPPPRSPVLAAFRRLEAVLAATGRARRPDESIGELRARLPRVGSAALLTLERECYGASPPSEQENAAAAETLDDLARTLAEVTRQ